jgi:hypothetical protein
MFLNDQLATDHITIFADLAVPARIGAVALANGVLFDSAHQVIDLGGETFDGLTLQATAISTDLADVNIENMVTKIMITDPVAGTETEYLIVSPRPDGWGLTLLELTEA